MEQQIDIFKDMEHLTAVPKKLLLKIAEKESLCIGSTIKSALDEKKSEVLINIGIGGLAIDLTNMQCKFSPNSFLKQSIKTAIKNGIDPVTISLEQEFVKKLLKIYSEEVE